MLKGNEVIEYWNKTKYFRDIENESEEEIDMKKLWWTQCKTEIF